MNIRVVACLEVAAVFSATLCLVAIAGISSVGTWVRSVTGRALLEYVGMIALPLLILVLSRRSLTNYGISLRNLSYHLNVTLTAFIPTALASVALSLLDYREWRGALILSAVQVALLFVLGRLLKRMPAPGSSRVVAGFVLVGLARGLGAQPAVPKAFSALLFYVFFLGLGEELLFRGYIQSRLNFAFGRPFAFSGVQWGWGAVIASLFFALMHVINLGSTMAGQWHLTPWWGLWTFFAGLVLAFVREQTGSIVAPALLHGLPQGIAYALLGL